MAEHSNDRGPLPIPREKVVDRCVVYYRRVGVSEERVEITGEAHPIVWKFHPWCYDLLNVISSITTSLHFADEVETWIQDVKEDIEFAEAHRHHIKAS